MSGYEAGRRCDLCGAESPYVPVCGECEMAQRAAAAAVRAHAAGYAEAVGDIRQLALDNANRLSGPEMAKAKSRVVKREIWVAADALLGLVTVIDCGAHVGAAKKGVKDV